MARFIHVFDVCFSIEAGHDDSEAIPAEALLDALEERVRYLRDNPHEILEAVGFVDVSEG